MRLGRSSNPKGKHRQAEPDPPPPPPPPPSSSEVELQPDTELDAYLAALAPSDADKEATDPGRRFGNAKAYQVRLSEDSDTKLRQLAAERQIAPLVLLQDWLQQRLDWELRGRRI